MKTIAILSLILILSFAKINNEKEDGKIKPLGESPDQHIDYQTNQNKNIEADLEQPLPEISEPYIQPTNMTLPGGWSQIDVNTVRSSQHYNKVKRFAKSKFHGKTCGGPKDQMIWRLKKFETQVVAGYNYKVTYEARLIDDQQYSQAIHVFHIFESIEGEISLDGCDLGYVAMS
ncbi:hypothetical protein IMG5_020400 [Ichthyophthirius multifiliis]|uniref:Cystatin domain-containing protein n=1 Tax=Ichthyophthirius multifiliis TaxID=5932 RepID=G0QKP0_ICHMU|nr:hypothetical protein IMG5_020400 [Ichthyophthirius multifiliis]EGR34215.1 hypothetical protein IMG5_020400 [Ichthyophthirius multifiliis]|eukprot:XP_004039519.1 hypothetical protein IMG5_020400 [Ichthyophthirius multifiliis]